MDRLTDEHAPAGSATGYASRDNWDCGISSAAGLRVVLMLIVFLRERAYRFSAIATLVLTILFGGVRSGDASTICHSEVVGQLRKQLI